MALTDKIRHYNHLCDLANQLATELIEMLGTDDQLVEDAALLVLRIKQLEQALMARNESTKVQPYQTT